MARWFRKIKYVLTVVFSSLALTVPLFWNLQQHSSVMNTLSPKEHHGSHHSDAPVIRPKRSSQETTMDKQTMVATTKTSQVPQKQQVRKEGNDKIPVLKNLAWKKLDNDQEQRRTSSGGIKSTARNDRLEKDQAASKQSRKITNAIKGDRKERPREDTAPSMTTKNNGMDSASKPNKLSTNNMNSVELEPTTTTKTNEEMTDEHASVRYTGQEFLVWTVFNEVIGILHENQVDYFLMAGSLLGFARIHDDNPSNIGWLDSDIDLAVSTSWMANDDNLQMLHQEFEVAGFVLHKDYPGGDGTRSVGSLGGARVYRKEDVEVELVATDVVQHEIQYFVNGFRHEHYHVVCPKRFESIESRPWGSSLSVRVPMPYHLVLQATYGDNYDRKDQQRNEFEASRMANAMANQNCLIVQNANSTTTTTKQVVRGIVTCLTSRQSMADGLVLVKTMEDQWKVSSSSPGAVVELYHMGILSYHLQARLELYPFVRVINLLTMAPSTAIPVGDVKDGDDAIKCQVQALQTTKLRHVLLVSNPSIQFLFHPGAILHTTQYVHEQDRTCQKKLSDGSGTCVTLVEPELDFALLNATKNTSKRIRIVRGYPRHSSSTIQMMNQYAAAHVHQISPGLGLWLHPTTHFAPTTLAVGGNVSLVFPQKTPAENQSTPSAYQHVLESYWHSLVEARQFLLMDRPIEWVASDGGLFWQFSTLYSRKATNQSHYVGALVQTIDLTISSDQELFVTYSDEQFTALPFQGNNLARRVSNATAKEIKNWTIPCLSEKTIKKWLYDNPYLVLQCQTEKIAKMDDFIIYSIDREVTYNLKGPSPKLQIEQAERIADTFQEWDDVLLANGQVSVRFHYIKNTRDKLVIPHVLPDFAVRALRSEKKLRDLPYYLTAPSTIACKQLLDWLHNQVGFGNKNVLGCYIHMNDRNMAISWSVFQSKNAVSVNVGRFPSQKKRSLPAAKVICEVPTPGQSTSINRTFWQMKHIECIEEGFEFIAHPWRIPMAADFSPLPSGFESFATAIESQLKETIIPSRLQDTMNSNATTRPTWSKYISHWGFTHLSDWDNRQEVWFEGDVQAKRSMSSDEDSAVFRCITKVLVTMLLLRLQELGLMSLDDRVPTGQESSSTPTWRNILSNTAGADQRFHYDNDPWKDVPAAVEKACSGLNFTYAINHYVLEPMGIVGKFDVDTIYPPYAARGFVGPLEDLMLIGATLTLGGLSPKTRQRVLAFESVQQLLNKTTSSQAFQDPVQKIQKEAFVNDTVVHNMKHRFRDARYSRSTFTVPTHVMDGYALGLWCVLGWRRTRQGEAIRGWVALGSSEALVYFDTTGFVFAFHSPTRVLGFELTTAFASMVSDTGDLLLTFQEELMKRSDADNVKNAVATNS
ncbi:expressed unknown protein [Seminavis robusta]|uniref:Uncharacterized protein n=1 Tax=Seminavis robusta TaxID=568900 RepID=A0A9N8ELK4_9STRA|nr:expressed unknown protein [Seminavis robusta]|eukprot:Sro1405_g269840.1 n/a (1378) ;mRNA; r:22506-26639